ncbi:MAG TPA: glycoside hydrolase family 15 protein [Streptomyces sp.]|nr:glycoside hydrolase family 15 protein [Streptomyces sp.]
MPEVPKPYLSPLHAKPWVLRSYGFVADGERGALIDPDGTVVWLCAPRWDSDAVFSQLIGGPGGFRVCPEDDWRVWGGSYEDGTLIRVSRWTQVDSIVECREALAMPASPDRLVLLRRIRAVRGEARVSVLMDARPGFGAHTMSGGRTESGVWHARAGGHHLRLTGMDRPEPHPEGGVRRRLVLPEGAHHDLVLEISDHECTDVLDPDALWHATEQEWRRRVPDCQGLAAPRDARQAYAVLQGMTTSTGGMVAAATTSLPERANAGRNFDYRFTWIRDQCYAGLAVAAHGPHPLLDGSVRFVAERILEHGPELKAVYRTDGSSAPPEQRLRLSGYPGGGDKVGNNAATQFQLDAYGEALELFSAAARLDRLDEDGRRAAAVAVEAIGDNWRAKDAGIWELEERWWTHSRLSAVAGLKAAARSVPGVDAENCRALARTIGDEARSRCLHRDGYWQRAEDDEGVDAALLMAFVRGALPEGDPSAARTRQEITERLTDDGYVYRFRHSGAELGEEEGAFLLCSHMMAMAELAGGDRVGAVRWFERARAACGPPALFSEEYDVHQRQLRGNMPQAFVHAMLLETAVHLARPEPVLHWQ